MEASRLMGIRACSAPALSLGCAHWGSKCGSVRIYTRHKFAFVKLTSACFRRMYSISISVSFIRSCSSSSVSCKTQKNDSVHLLKHQCKGILASWKKSRRVFHQHRRLCCVVSFFHHPVSDQISWLTCRTLRTELTDLQDFLTNIHFSE